MILDPLGIRGWGIDMKIAKEGDIVSIAYRYKTMYTRGEFPLVNKEGVLGAEIDDGDGIEFKPYDPEYHDLVV